LTITSNGVRQWFGAIRLFYVELKFEAYVYVTVNIVVSCRTIPRGSQVDRVVPK
jgi:hypothetical protein